MGSWKSRSPAKKIHLLTWEFEVLVETQRSPRNPKSRPFTPFVHTAPNDETEETRRYHRLKHTCSHLTPPWIPPKRANAPECRPFPELNSARFQYSTGTVPVCRYYTASKFCQAVRSVRPDPRITPLFVHTVMPYALRGQCLRLLQRRGGRCASSW